MDTIIIQTDALKTKALTDLLKAFEVKYDIISSKDMDKNNEIGYNPAFVKEILQSKEDKKNGKGTKVTIEELESLWK